MRIVNSIVLMTTLAALVLTALANPQRSTQSDISSLNTKIRRFAPTIMTANTARLSPNDRKALQWIIAAAKLFDPMYRRQIWSGNESLLKLVETDKSPLGRMRLHYFKINQGPWSQLDD